MIEYCNHSQQQGRKKLKTCLFLKSQHHEILLAAFYKFLLDMNLADIVLYSLTCKHVLYS
jgi:hypothetical protein